MKTRGTQRARGGAYRQAHRGVWRKLTLIFSTFQALAGQAFAALFAATQAYEAIFATGAGLLTLASLSAAMTWRYQHFHKKI